MCVSCHRSLTSPPRLTINGGGNYCDTGGPSYGDLDACAHKAGDPLSTLPIEVTELVRTYRVPDKMPGIAGALKHVVRPLYREITALSGISMQVGPGARVACVGPNGAGKSTLLKILTGVLVPSSGSVKVNGLVPSSDRVRNNRQIGAVFGLRWTPTPGQNLPILRWIICRVGQAARSQDAVV